MRYANDACFANNMNKMVSCILDKWMNKPIAEIV